MKTSRKILSLAVLSVIATVSTGVMAQQAEEARLAGTTAIAPNAGNSFEREITPALREQGRKKVILENKKLDLEIEKVDLSILKVQQEALEVTNPLAAAYGGMGRTPVNGAVLSSVPAPKVVDASSLNNAPVSLPQGLADASNVPAKMPSSEGVNINLSGEALDRSDSSIRVLMISGLSTNLQAKIMHNFQGGYVVGKGDILPNGKKVFNVTEQFIEIAPPNSKNKKDRTKIYVSGYPTTKEIDSQNNLVIKDREENFKDSSISLQQAGDIGKTINTGFGLPLQGVPITTVTSPPPPPAGQIR